MAMNWNTNETYQDTLEGHLRILSNNKIIKLLEKVKCDDCGSKENLAIHHSSEYKFADIMYDALELLKLPYKKCWKEYSKEEINLIEIIVLGLHLYTRFIVLCEKCHNDKHRKDNFHKPKINRKVLANKYSDQLNYFKCLYPDATTIDFFHNFNKFYIDKYIDEHKNIYIVAEKIKEFRNDIFKNIIIEHVGYKSRINNSPINIEGQGLKVINRIFELYESNYRIISGTYGKKPNRSKRYWLILNIENTIKISEGVYKQKEGEEI